MSREYDAIVIGSGVSGLTSAIILSRIYRRRVALLEQHFKAGGFAHSFSRKGGYCWDVGLHYVGSLMKNSRARRLFDYLTGAKVEWKQMPFRFEVFEYPGFKYSVPSDPSLYKSELCELFPSEKRAIKRYFRDIQIARKAYIVHSLVDILPLQLGLVVKSLWNRFGKIAKEKSSDYIDRHFSDIRLKALLFSQWGDYGLSPEKSSFGIHSLIVTHYLNGGWYPVGGSEAVVSAMVARFRQSGGEIFLRTSVEEITLDSLGRVEGLVAKEGGEISNWKSPLIISSAGAYNTYCRFLPKTSSPDYCSSVSKFHSPTSMMILYLGLNRSPAELSFTGANHWIYGSFDHSENAPSSSDQIEPKCCFLSFPSLKEGGKDIHSAEIIAHVDHSSFEKWSDTSWMKRGEDYEKLKADLSAKLLAFVEEFHPGFSEMVAYSELSTPLSIEHFDRSQRGVPYGVPGTPERFDQPWVSSKTPIEGLFLTGSDAFSPGIMGALMAGVKTASVQRGALHFLPLMIRLMWGARFLRLLGGPKSTGVPVEVKN